MKKLSLATLLFAFLIAPFSACKETIEPPSVDDQNYYYPVNIGRYYEYQVDSAFWDYTLVPNDTTDTISYLIRENYDTDFPNNVGDLETRVKIAKNGGGGFMDIDVQSAQRFYNSSKKVTTAERTIQNIKYVMLRFPCAVEDTFNRNQKNNLLPNYWRVNAIGGTFAGIGKSYSPTLEIYNYREEDSAHIKQSLEIYAHDVGLVYKEITDVTGRVGADSVTNIPIMKRIVKGYQYIQTITDFRKK